MGNKENNNTIPQLPVGAANILFEEYSASKQKEAKKTSPNSAVDIECPIVKEQSGSGQAK